MGFAAVTLAVDGAGFGEAVTARLCRSLAEADGPAAERLLAALLQGVFRHGAGDVPLFAAALEPTQYVLLRTMADASNPWTWNGTPFANIPQMLRGMGLPARPADIDSYLTGRPVDEFR